MDPELRKDLQTLNKTLHSSNLSSKNRLLSIQKDTLYVEKLRNQYFPDLPILPNERCGNWYVSPASYKEITPTYFKSTDGHTNNWSFSTRRLNLHLLKTLNDYNGALIVDSTRRGKKIPDSLSKTIPIWIAMMNKVMYSELEIIDLLETPNETVSEYEKSRILEKLPSFYNELAKFKHLVEGQITGGKRIKPFWVYPGCRKIPLFTGLEDFVPLILVSASEQSQDGENKVNGYTYVQGAGDDHELWSRGLSPRLYWDNADKFENVLEMDDAELTVVIDDLVCGGTTLSKKGEAKWAAELVVHCINNNLSFGKINPNVTAKSSDFKLHPKTRQYTKIIVLDSSFKCINEDKNDCSKCCVYSFKLDSGSKKSSKLLRTKIPEIVQISKPTDNTLVLCRSGEDLSVAIVLCLLNRDKEKLKLSKDTIRGDLIHLMKFATLNPQRATLNAVNSFLLT